MDSEAETSLLNIDKGNTVPHASDLNHNMDANPSEVSKGHMPIDMFPKEHRQKVLQGLLALEVSKLEKMVVRALNCHEKQQEEIMRIVFVYSMLYLTFTEDEGMQKGDLEKFYAYALQSEKTMFAFLKDTYLSDTGNEFWKLLDYQKKLHREFCSGKYNQTFDVGKGKELLDSVLTDALKLCCERKFPLFLHMLVDIGKVNISEPFDLLFRTTPLHHAALSGNLSAISYLLSRGAELKVKDIYDCTPLHYAGMFGHKITTDYLFAQDVSKPIIDSKCSNGYTASEYIEAFFDYMKTRCVEQDSIAKVINDAHSLTQHHLQKLEKHWKDNGIANSVRENAVDFSSGEAEEIQNTVIDVLQNLLSRVAEDNPIFKGELKQLGSSADGVRLFCPDEFDFNFIFSHEMSGLQGGGLKVEVKELDKRTAASKGHDCYVSVTAHQEQLNNWISGSELLPEFLRLIKKNLTDISPPDPRLRLVPPGARYKMVGVGLTMRWCGKEYPLLLIDIDLVPVVQALWPENLHRPCLLPPDTHSIYASTSLTSEWRLSSGMVENNVMQKLTEEQMDVYLACKRLICTLKVDGWVPTHIKQQYRYFDNQFFKIPVLNGFILKNCFFRELEKCREEHYWQKEEMLERMISIFQKMCRQDGRENDKGEKFYVPSQVYAYFGGAKYITNDSGEENVVGATDKSYVGYGAPIILDTLEYLKS